jgi:hypothetical protein
MERPNIMGVINKREKKWTVLVVGLRVGEQKCMQDSYAEK